MTDGPSAAGSSRPSDNAVAWAAINQWAFEQLDGDDPRRAEIFQLVTNRSMQIGDAVISALRTARAVSRSGVPITRSKA